jgi:hypothetical protein
MRSCEETVSVVGEAGFSLLEVIIALAILMTLLISVSSLLVTSFKVGANSRYRQAATEIATSNLDYQVQVGSTTLVGEVGDTALPTITEAGQQYISEMEISPYTSSNANACANPNGGLAMLKITVWVTWANVTSGTTWWVTSSPSYTGSQVEETTLLALPSTAFNGNDGSVLVDITGTSGSADGIQGVTVTASYGGTTYTAVTSSSGCALFANLSAHTWTIGATKTGYIDDLDDWSSSTNSATPLSASAPVVAGNVYSVNFTYDQEATVTPTYSVAPYGGVQGSTPTGVSNLPLTFYTSYGTAFPSTGVVMAAPASVFPSNTTPSYYVVAGSCGIESAPDGNNITGAQTDGQAITVAPGGQAAPAFALTPVELVITHGGTPVANATVTATSTDSNCATGSLAMPTLGLGTTCNPTGSLYPCTYQLAAHRVRHSRVKGRASAVLVFNCTSNCSTSTSLSATTSATYGSPVTFTADVSCTASGCNPVTGGTVTFTNATTSTTMGTGTVSSGTATLTTSSLPVGSTHVTATYAGSGKWNGSGPSGSVTQVITQAGTTTSLAWSPIPSPYGTVVQLTATVTANSPSTATPTGTVTFQNGLSNISGCVNVTLSAGQATCMVSGLAGGSYTMKATFAGSTNFLGPTSSTLTQSVTAASTTTTVTSSSPSNTSTYGSSVTFTAAVASATGATAVGTVNFTSGGTTITGCGSVAVSSGVATCASTSLPVGSQSIVATFTPTTSANFAASTGSLTQQVNPASTTPYLLSGLPVGHWVLKITYGAATSTFNLTIVPGEGALLLQEAD